jgi:hypothetical protein
MASAINASLVAPPLPPAPARRLTLPPMMRCRDRWGIADGQAWAAYGFGEFSTANSSIVQLLV